MSPIIGANTDKDIGEKTKLNRPGSEHTPENRPVASFGPTPTNQPSSVLKRKLKGVVFDMDGTLCLPQNYMFKEMRDALGITKETDILDHLESLTGDEASEADAKLETIERRAMLKMVPQPGLTELMDYVVAKQLRTTILTRNFPVPVEYLRSNFLRAYPMDPIITRHFKPPKPAPDGLFHIANNWGLDATELVMVGDSVDDILAGHNAGSVTVLLKSPFNDDVAKMPETQFIVHSLPELIPILEEMLA